MQNPVLIRKNGSFCRKIPNPNQCVVGRSRKELEILFGGGAVVISSGAGSGSESGVSYLNLFIYHDNIM